MGLLLGHHCGVWTNARSRLELFIPSQGGGDYLEGCNYCFFSAPVCGYPSTVPADSDKTWPDQHPGNAGRCDSVSGGVCSVAVVSVGRKPGVDPTRTLWRVPRCAMVCCISRYWCIRSYMHGDRI